MIYLEIDRDFGDGFATRMASKGITVRPISPCLDTDTYVVIGEADVSLIESDEAVKRVYLQDDAVRRPFVEKTTHIVRVGDVEIGSDKVVTIAGPCSIDTMDNLDTIARGAKEAGATILRGGAFKPRTSCRTFQGLGYEGLDMLVAVGAKYNMPIVSEIVSVRDVDRFVSSVDMIQVGARNMQNYDLLRELGRTNTPILLKRGFGNTVDELLSSMEYILEGGNDNVVLAERGVRGIDNGLRATLDLTAVALLKTMTTAPILVDPSHGTGEAGLVTRLALASVAVGADGIMVETHCDPTHALSDGRQSITPSELSDMVVRARRVAHAVDREM